MTTWVNGTPLCPVCKHDMVRMSTGFGWKCKLAGTWDAIGRKWTGTCTGVVWDKAAILQPKK